MIIAAAELKKSLKPLNPVRTETYVFGEHGGSALDSDVWVINDSPFSGLGTFSINGKKLSSVINRMSGQVEVIKEDKFLTLKSAKAKVDLEVQNVKPLKLPEAPEKYQTINLSEFKKVLALAAGSASSNKSAKFGGVVQLQTLSLGLEETSPSGYRIIGTDGQVMTVVKSLVSLSHEFKVLLNLESAAVVQIMDGATLDLGETNERLWLRAGTVRVFPSKPVKQYPDFDKAIGFLPKLQFQFKPEDWLSALKTVEPLIDEDLDRGSVALQFSESVVVFENVGVGSRARDEAGYEQLEPDPIFDKMVTVSNLRLPAKYLSSFLAKAGAEATLSLVNKDNPIRFDSGNMSAVIMPVATPKEKK